VNYTFLKFLRDNIVHVGIFATCVACVCLMAHVMRISAEGVVAIAVVCCIAGAASLVFEYFRHRKFYVQAADFAAEAREFSEMGSFVEVPHNLQDQLSYDLADSVRALANAQVTDARHELHSYREYIELWIHEAKTPIAAAKLTLANNPGAQNDTLALELEAVERAVEQALFYARSADVARDFVISTQNVGELVRGACKQNSRLMIEAGLAPVFEIDKELSVLTDPIWMTFILGQLIANSAKYGAKQIVFSCKETTEVLGAVELLIADDGCGISSRDLPRIFDRGFTGKNGRNHLRSTGMGLYLVKRLSNQMGVDVSAWSAGAGQGITISIRFTGV
jgi:signal transduction histidine kinase